MLVTCMYEEEVSIIISDEIINGMIGDHVSTPRNELHAQKVSAWGKFGTISIHLPSLSAFWYMSC